MNSGIRFIDRDTKFACDCLVVGSGAGGAVTASYLAEQGKDVLIIEEGPYVASSSHEKARITSSFPKLWRDGGVIPVLGKTTFAFAEGRGVGGGTMINSALMHRLPADVVKNWSNEFAIQGLDSHAIVEAHEKIERQLHVQSLAHRVNIANELFKKGAAGCGFKGVDVPVAAIEKDRLVKMDMQNTYLKKAVEKGAIIMPDCRAKKINIQNQRAVSVSASVKGATGENFSVEIGCRSLFICAGALQSPLLLRRSGIKRNVGNSLQFHPSFRVVAEFPEPLNAYAVEMPSFQVKEFAPQVSMGASVSMPSYIAAGLAFNWQENKKKMAAVNNMANFYVMTKSFGRGKIRNIPLLEGGYIVSYELDEKEIRNLSFGFAKLSEVLFAAGAVRLYPAIEEHGPFSSTVETHHYEQHNLPVDKTHLMSIHSFSSCPMGEDLRRCAVDSYGKVHGYENIYLNDASILPTSPGVNPQGPLMAIADRNMEHNSVNL